jgi:RNA polymerase sigma-70 factor (ECF subfamily)
VTDREGSTQVHSMRETFRVFFEEHFDYVYRSLRRLGVQERDLEDVAHDLFVRVNAELPGFDSSRPHKPWLFAFAFRFASDYRRLGRHRAVPTPDVDVVDDALGAEAAYLDAEKRALLARALDALDLDRRAVVVLHEIDGVPVPEIATALGIPLNTAYSRLRLGREALTAAVKRLRARER